ncbi:MAG: phage integrase family protein [Epulopiscium sp.]|nr:phage integrase family protein [Candidatus Epulonipiscium sp.]
MKCYYSAFHKLPHIINSCYHTNLSLIGYTLPPSPNNSKIRNSTMSPKDFQKIKTYLQNSQGYGKVGLQIAKITGMRSEEICKLKYKDIHITDTSATIKVIDGKGKRSREIPVTKQEDIDYLKTLVSAPNTQNDRICAIQSNSLNKAVRRAMKATNLDKKYTNTTIHSIRKMYAQNLYNELRSQNYTPMQAWNQVSKNLGHGENRPDLIKVYLSNIN